VRELGKPQVPGTPIGVRVTRHPTSGRPIVAWPYVWGAARYEVWRSGVSRRPVRKLGTTKVMRWVDATAARTGSYYYFVRALNSAGKSPIGKPGVSAPR
jgi:hypothetical protein